MADLCTTADVKSAAGISTNADDALIETTISAASAAIQAWCGRELAPVAGTPTRRFEARSRVVDLAPHDLLSASSVTLHPTASSPSVLTTAQWLGHLAPEGTITVVTIAASVTLASDTWDEFGVALLDITGTWGVATTPTDVARACALTAASWLDRAVDAYAAQVSVDTPGGARLASGVGAAIPAAARRLLDPYRRLPVP